MLRNLHAAAGRECQWPRIRALSARDLNPNRIYSIAFVRVVGSASPPKCPTTIDIYERTFVLKARVWLPDQRANVESIFVLPISFYEDIRMALEKYRLGLNSLFASHIPNRQRTTIVSHASQSVSFGVPTAAARDKLRVGKVTDPITALAVIDSS